MCGIFCTVYNCKTAKSEISEKWSLCKDVILARGPDKLGKIEENLAEQWHGYFYASVLWMQGIKPVSQPLVDVSSNILLWNGDIFSGNMFKENNCDTEIVLSALQNSSDIPFTLKEIKGPFSFIYYQKSTKCLYFGRDRFGRHSLLFKINRKCDSLFLTSVAVKAIQDIVELPAIGIFIADLSCEKIELTCIPWYIPNEQFMKNLGNFKEQINNDVNILKCHYLPKVEELCINAIPNTEMGFLKYFNSTNQYKTIDEMMEFLLNKDSVCKNINNLLLLLNESVRRRVTVIPNYCKNCTKFNVESTLPCQHGKVGILFSGGVDSAVLAVIAHNNIQIDQAIDLINVAFEKKHNSNYQVPDRVTGKQTLSELLKVCPGRRFNFIEVDVPIEELERYRSKRISNLIYPNATVLDDSLGCAVWFASRAKGILYPEKQSYESTCRVLLLGMGADEQFGGYMRHRTIFKRNGWHALSKELKVEFDRISERNLGRDDRMVADHGRQSRLPYLDEDLVEFVQQLPPWERCCPTEKFPPGLGDKLLLRLLARKIGLKEASKFPKRAFQFGSRIANGKQNAKDLSKEL